VSPARLAQVSLPDFGLPEKLPELSSEMHVGRLERLRERMAK